MNKFKLPKLSFQKLNGLIPAIIQDASSNQVLMLGFMNKEALRQTLKKGHVIFWSRTRQCLWEKGANSGKYLKIVAIMGDCDSDTLLFKVKPGGPVCHTGKYACFD